MHHSTERLKHARPLLIVLLIVTALIAAGAAVVLAQPDDPAPTAPLTTDVLYTVQPNDNLTRISARFGLRADCLAQINQLPNPDLVFVGQVLVLSPTCALVQPTISGNLFATVAPPNAQPIQGIYVVQRGDILDVLASAFNVQLDCFAARNNLEQPGVIFPNETLLVPSDCPPYDGLSTAEPGRYVIQPLDPGASVPQVAAFVNYYLSTVNAVIEEVGYFAASDEALNA
ncbi:MAG: LysM peptidoglycan-binding domain-containing protein, partial [Chloroflexi bacterium]|nr:LysM peptidoglycan-binding domain-containing protein [Chloroflexota bacterium]